MELPIEKIKEFCKKWNIKEFAVFGSVLRDDFGADSDVDVLVTFAEGAGVYSLDDRMEIQDELERIFSRKVDFVDSSHLVNPFRKKEITRTKKVVYEAA